MSNIESKKMKLICPTCGIVESAAVHQKGSAYEASQQNGPALTYFVAQWNDEGVGGPKIGSATCGTCGSAAIIEGS